jgi:peptidoglycan hydrolase CwlO-like protein
MGKIKLWEIKLLSLTEKVPKVKFYNMGIKKLDYNFELIKNDINEIKSDIKTIKEDIKKLRR